MRAPKNLGDGLMTEADAENRQRASIVANNLQRDTRFIRRAGAWGYHDLFGGHNRNIARVISSLRLTSTCAPVRKVLIQVPGKRVVIINKQDHGGLNILSRPILLSFDGFAYHFAEDLAQRF